MKPTTKMASLKKWIGDNWLKLLFAGLILSLIIAFVVATHYRGTIGAHRIERETTTQDEQPLTLPSQLTGMEVDPALAKRPVLAVMIENSPNARPQTGLDSAGIVFEAVAEGGITRYIAMFQENMPANVGPIRSLRPYYVDWIMSFDASVAHVGGSAQALQMVSRRNAKSLDQFRHSGPYYRDGSRYAPHNMYARTGDLRQLQSSLGHNRSDFLSIPRSNDDPAENANATVITVNYSSSLYQAQFRYRESSNSYVRRLAGNPHIDAATGEAITVKNLIVIKMPTSSDGQYAIMETIGSGDALVFKDGTVINAKWRQTGYSDRMVITDADGNQVPLNRGDSWFAILPSGRSVTY